MNLLQSIITQNILAESNTKKPKAASTGVEELYGDWLEQLQQAPGMTLPEFREFVMDMLDNDIAFDMAMSDVDDVEQQKAKIAKKLWTLYKKQSNQPIQESPVVPSPDVVDTADDSDIDAIVRAAIEEVGRLKARVDDLERHEQSEHSNSIDDNEPTVGDDATYVPPTYDTLDKPIPNTSTSKDVEQAGYDAWSSIQLPQNQYDPTTLAGKAWDRGFKRAVREMLFSK